MKFFRPWSINEQRLVPVSIEDYLPPGHLAIWVRDIVFELTRKDLLNWRVGTEGGRPAFNPGMIAAVLIFAYIRGIRSSRRIHRLMAENIAFKVISGEQSPNFRTLCEFRRVHHAFFQKVFTRVILLALQLKMIDLGAVLVDGTVLQANASKKHSRRLRSLRKLEKEELEERTAHAVQGMVQRMVAEAEAADGRRTVCMARRGTRTLFSPPTSQPAAVWSASGKPSQRWRRQSCSGCFASPNARPDYSAWPGMTRGRGVG